jgi:hypothetical protein
MKITAKPLFLVLGMFLLNLASGCHGYDGLYYKGDEYRDTYINLKTKTLHFGVSIKEKFFVMLTGDTIGMTVYIKPSSPVKSFKLPDVMYEYGKNKEVEYRVIQSKGIKQLYSYTLSKSDWLDSNTIKRGSISPFQ